MSVGLQKANFWKRFSAFLFDIIFVVCLALAVAIGVSFFFKYDARFDALMDIRTEVEQQYQVSFDITEEEYDALTSEEKANYNAANNDFLSRTETLKTYRTLLGMMFANIAISLFAAYLIVYFVLPLLFKNGQTLGKKIFGIAVMRTNCVKISPPVLFVRSLIGLYAMETFVPLFIFAMMIIGFLGIVGTITLFLMLFLEVGVMIATKTNSSIHDLLADTVVVDMASQRIFDTEQDLIAYKQEQHELEVNQSKEEN